ncbi:TPA: hypothetical protein HA281_05290 [Candidatus Woesearchaeota archaeon]|nr:hypothetical protein [Candidatus Woesearchaeota archaeon]
MSMDAPTISLIILSALGMLISLYAFRVKQKLAKDKGYKPVCDISEKISCTKALDSGHGALFILPNSLYGLAFYALALALAWLGQAGALFALSAPAVLGSVYLAYVSFFRLRVACPLCTIIYALNIALLVMSAYML